MVDVTVRRADFGYFVRPGTETGSGQARLEPCLGYLVDLPDGALLVDTAMGSHPDSGAVRGARAPTHELAGSGNNRLEKATRGTHRT
jgi:hypothetical protein